MTTLRRINTLKYWTIASAGLFAFEVALGFTLGGWWTWAAAAICAASLAFNLHVRRQLLRWGHPVPPENVRLVSRDGTTVPVELMYHGVVKGLHEWVATAPAAVPAGAQLRADMIPAETSIRVAVTHSPGSDDE